MLGQLTYFTNVLSIVGDIIKIRATGVGLGDLGLVENWDGECSLAQVIEIQQDEVSLQVFTGGKGLSTEVRVRFMGHASQVTYSDNILGRVFDGAGMPIDGGPSLQADPRIEIGGPSVNPMMRVVPILPLHMRCLVSYASPDITPLPLFAYRGNAPHTPIVLHTSPHRDLGTADH